MASYNMYMKLFLQSLFVTIAFVPALQSTNMKVSGKITVPGLREGVSLGEESFLRVKFQNIGLMDASAELIGEDRQVIPARTKLGVGSEPLNYTIVCEKPAMLGPFYSVSAVLNVGWKATGDEWLRKGDYFTDTTHSVELSDEIDDIVADIEMVYYPK